MDKEFESKYKQFKIDLVTACTYADMEYYNEITESLALIKTSLEDKYKHTHCDDDNTNQSLSKAIDYLDSAIGSFENLKFYDGDGNRF